MIPFENPTYKGKILNRYKRFFADVKLDSGEVITAHTPNTGTMKTCWEPGWTALVSKHDNPNRKLQYTLELTHNGETWIGVNTSRPNKIVAQWIREGLIPELSQYTEIKPEVKIGDSRIDLLLSNNNEKCFVEIKNVTMLGSDRMAIFPDAVSTRGLKHLNELEQIASQGHRAVMFYLVQRKDVDMFGPAFDIDPDYAQKLRQVYDNGVDVLAYQCELNEEGMSIGSPLPLSI